MTPLAITTAERPRRGRGERLAAVLFKVPQLCSWRGIGLLVAFLAYLLVIARATVLGYAFAIPAALLYGPEVASGGPGRLYATLSFVVFEELARLGYAWDARNKTASLAAFFVFTVLVETLAYYQAGFGLDVYLAARAPSIGIHLLATLALTAAFRRPRLVVPVFAAVLGIHVAFDYWAPAIVSALTGMDHVHALPCKSSLK